MRITDEHLSAILRGIPSTVTPFEISGLANDLFDAREELAQRDTSTVPAPVPMLLTCPACTARHVDVGEFETKPHHTHACQSCGMCWRPAIVPTVGVQFLPGFKNEK